MEAGDQRVYETVERWLLACAASIGQKIRCREGWFACGEAAQLLDTTFRQKDWSCGEKSSKHWPFRFPGASSRCKSVCFGCELNFWRQREVPLRKVNLAYSLQLCPKSSFIHPENRDRERFMCLYCRYESQADRVGAYNHKERIGDLEILPWTPRNRLKTILLERFPSGQGNSPIGNPKKGTVPGQQTPRSGIPQRMDAKREQFSS